SNVPDYLEAGGSGLEPPTRHGECAHAPAPDPAGGRFPGPPAALLPRGTAESHPRARRRTGRPVGSRPGVPGPAEGSPPARVMLPPQPRTGPREPPLRLAFFSRLSY